MTVRWKTLQLTNAAAMVSPNASQHKEDKLLYPDHYLVWYTEVDSGPHSRFQTQEHSEDEDLAK